MEVNALWYNAVCQALAWSRGKDKRFEKAWESLPGLIRNSFIETFWNEEMGYLADYSYQNFRDMSVRPNQVLAVDGGFSVS